MNKDKMTFEKAEPSMKEWKNTYREKTYKYMTLVQNAPVFRRCSSNCTKKAFSPVHKPLGFCNRKRIL